MPQDYIYDIFISYRRKQPVLGWVTNHFHPLIEQWLPNFMPYNHEPRVFIDLQMETGTEWPSRVRQALKMSRCLLAVWSPQYFQSKWCQAELQTMLQRERLLGMRTDQNPSGLIYAVLFSGANCLPPNVQAIQYKDLSKWNYPHPVFRKSQQFLNFDKQVQKLCQELARMIRLAPSWQGDWPTVVADLSPSRDFALPRLQ